MSFGETIKRLRKEKGFTQDQLANLLNVTPQAISRWENNSAMPDISQLVPLANVFRVSTDTLLEVNVKETEKQITGVIHKMLDVGILENASSTCFTKNFSLANLVMSLFESLHVTQTSMWRASSRTPHMRSYLKRMNASSSPCGTRPRPSGSPTTSHSLSMRTVSMSLSPFQRHRQRLPQPHCRGHQPHKSYNTEIVGGSSGREASGRLSAISTSCSSCSLAMQRRSACA